jgi:hypothetical protein
MRVGRYSILAYGISQQVDLTEFSYVEGIIGVRVNGVLMIISPSQFFAELCCAAVPLHDHASHAALHVVGRKLIRKSRTKGLNSPDIRLFRLVLTRKR